MHRRGEKTNMKKVAGKHVPQTCVTIEGAYRGVSSGVTDKEDKASPGLASGFTRHNAKRKASLFATHFIFMLKPGTRLLDCGCGPGSITTDFAEFIPNGEVVGVDRAPHHIDIARSLANRRDVKNVTFMIGDILKLPFDAHEFDAAWICSVLSHLERPVEALKEVHRVLKPDGVIAITDADWQADIVFPELPIVTETKIQLEQVFRERGMNTHLARSHRAQLREAGFKSVEGKAITECYGTPEETRAFAETVLQVMREHFPGKKSNFSEEARENAWRAWADHPDAFFSRVHVQAIGRK